MPQFPPWKRQLAAWTDAASLRRSQLRDAVTDIASRADQATSTIPAGVVDLAVRTRVRVEQLPRAMVDEVRRRVNVLDLATKHDVEAQSKLGRSRVSFVLKEFLEAQRAHDEELLKSLRSEIQEELQCFAAAIDDDLFADVEPTRSTESDAPRRASAGLEYPDDDEELDLVDYRGIESTDDDVDLMDGDAAIRRAILDATDD